MNPINPWRAAVGVLVVALPVTALAAPPAAEGQHDVRGILSNHCFTCHGPDEEQRRAGLRLDDRESALAPLESGNRAIVRGNLAESELIRRITSTDPDVRMPPAEFGKPLTAGQIERLSNWIAAGAGFARHWSYIPPQRPPTPLPSADADTASPPGAIDRFLRTRLDREGLTPAPPADRAALIRRMSLDLTGLPPTAAEVDAFVDDPSPQAVERLVDRLLDSPAFGEHWARKWLDLARYADSAGYADDPPRTIWAYRDWVIRAINANLPFDQFTIAQLAGDLLPDPTEDQLVATAFHRNTLTNNEGGTNDEEYRNVAIVDRVNTTFAVWMGTTIACAQCHNHKYDPISNEEYFQVFAVFNNSADHDQRDERPYLELWEQEHSKSEREQVQREIADLEAKLSAVQGDEAAAAEVNQQLELLKKDLELLAPKTTVPIMRELSGDQRRTTHIQQRGNFLAKGDEVEPGLPRALCDAEPAAPLDRLALAQWLVADDNPLTARVIVNRYWEALFGVGLVRTSEEFGNQGERPSHPELLDWLATEFVRLGWDRKAMLKRLVMTAAYQQSSEVDDDAYERDPENRLLARGPRFRLSAETVRDQALFVSGLLNRTMYGPPVRPMQPKLGVNAAFGSGIDWQPSRGGDRYRRGIYTTWRRSNPYPSMVSFDAPNREVCTIRRPRTNTPLQALVTLNDPVYVESAQALARRMANATGSPEEQAAIGFRSCLCRHPSPAEIEHLVGLFERTRAELANSPQAAADLATNPLGPASPGDDHVELAAWTVVANVVLNLDELVLKP